ncbi:MAG: signal recognition particle-docking protein FtsY [Dehalococcoidia bacterium]|nr:MAG: signal recognition particle-docking protein FtsY [Dehalococcoidia bacterium]
MILFDWLKKTELGVKRSREAWFSKITHLFDRGSVGEEIWRELEELLILADVGVDTTDKLVERVRQRVRTDKLADASEIKSALKGEMVNLLSVPHSLCHSERSEESPQVILVVGVNGSGKTTSIAKLAYGFTSQGKKVILAAADTFRAAAIDQIKYWGREVGAEVVAHQPGGDPGAVAFDAIQAARNRQAQAVIIDTAGRLHTKFNLMEELKKIKRAAAKHDASAPHEVLLVMDTTTGQNGIAQARYFTQAVDVTGIFLAKLDGTAKGGIVFAICDELNIPITYIGTGEKVQDIAPFSAEAFVNAILS